MIIVTHLLDTVALCQSKSLTSAQDKEMKEAVCKQVSQAILNNGLLSHYSTVLSRQSEQSLNVQYCRM